VPASQAFHAFYAVCKHTQSICRQDSPHCQACFLNTICDYGISKVGKK
jgi:endonuclease III